MTLFKKFFLLLMFYLYIAANTVYAVAYVETVKIECIPELYHLKIETVNIVGEIPYEHYKKNIEHYEKTQHIFDLTPVDKEYSFICSLPDGEYKVIIRPDYLRGYVVHRASRTANITVEYNKQALFENLTLSSEVDGAENIKEIVFKAHEGDYQLVGYILGSYKSFWKNVEYKERETPQGKD